MTAAVRWGFLAQRTPTTALREQAFAATRPAQATFAAPIALAGRGARAEPGPARLLPGGGASWRGTPPATAARRSAAGAAGHAHAPDAVSRLLAIPRG